MENINSNGVHRPPLVNNYENGDRDVDGLARLKGKILPGAKIVVIIWLIVYIGLLGVGIYGKNKCPVERYIPMYLIATASIGLVSKLLKCYKDKILPVLDVSQILTCLYAVEFILLIFGSYWVYKEYKPSYDPKEGNRYCDKTVYLVTLAYISILYVVTAMLVSGFLCFLVCIYFIKSTERTADPEAAIQEP